MVGLKENKLHFVNVTVIDAEMCNSTHMYNGALASNVVCTSVKIDDDETGGSKCQENFGSALLCGNELSGILSFGSQCVENIGNIGIYSDLSRYQTWINQVFREASRNLARTVIESIPVEIKTIPVEYGTLDPLSLATTEDSVTTTEDSEATTEDSVATTESSARDFVTTDVVDEKTTFGTTTVSIEEDFTAGTTVGPLSENENELLGGFRSFESLLKNEIDNELQTTTLPTDIVTETSTLKSDEPKTTTRIVSITPPTITTPKPTPEPKVVIITPSNYRSHHRDSETLKVQAREDEESTTPTSISNQESQSPIVEEMLTSVTR